jgi:excisionase family DNA binding protein
MDTQVNTELGKPAENIGFDTIDDLSRRMQCTPRTIQNWMKERRIPYVKIGRSVRFDWELVRKHLTGGAN